MHIRIVVFPLKTVQKIEMKENVFPFVAIMKGGLMSAVN